MAKFDACSYASVISGTVIVCTRDALFHGLAATGSAAAASITVHPGVAVGTKEVFYFTVPATSAYGDGPYTPVVCPGGITCTSVGTFVRGTVFFSYLHP